MNNKKKSKFHNWDDFKDMNRTPEEVAELEKQIDADVLEMDLRAIRELLGKTQTELSCAMGMAQGEISQLERRDDYLMSTVRRFVESLGGTLEVRAHFGEQSVRLRG